MNILQKIFADHYEEMIYLQHPRASIIENVDKMINCGDPSFGGAMYICPTCDNFKYVPFRCHSRFCPTCGNMYSIDRVTFMTCLCFERSEKNGEKNENYNERIFGNVGILG